MRVRRPRHKCVRRMMGGGGENRGGVVGGIDLGVRAHVRGRACTCLDAKHKRAQRGWRAHAQNVVEGAVGGGSTKGRAARARGSVGLKWQLVWIRTSRLK